MKKRIKEKLIYCSCAAAALLTTSCIDNNYDLDNIDGTSEFKINNLVLPVEMDPIELRDIIKVKEGDKIQEVTINGETFYAVEQSGDFHSNPIHINEFTATADKLNPSDAVFSLHAGKLGVKRRAGENQKLYFLLEEVYKPFEYQAGDVDGAVRELTYIDFKETHFTVNFTAALASNVTSQIESLKLKLPAGLVISRVNVGEYKYNSTTGEVDIPRVDIVNNKAQVVIYATGINLSSDIFHYDASTNSGVFDLNSEFTVKDGTLVVSGSASALSALPDEITFTTSYDLGNMEVTQILGSIAYNLEGDGLKIDPIRFNDIPDFLNSDQTNLVLANPQIYLQMNNPVGEYGLYYVSDFNIVAERHDAAPKYFPYEDFKVGAGTTSLQNYLLAPDPQAVKNIPAEFNSALNRLTYKNLGNLLSGAGLPQTLDISLDNPRIPEQKLTSPLKIGVDLDDMEGKYRILAPLALEGSPTSGSRIYYTETKDGWWTEDLDGLMIDDLIITATITNDLPLDATLKIIPINRLGEEIKDVTVVPVKMAGNTTLEHAEIQITGKITDLDGIKIVAEVTPDGKTGADGQPEALSPEQTIVLKDLKARVNGSYTKKF